MRCQHCHGATVIFVEPCDDNKVPGFVPCPECLGGQQHCCDGECAQPPVLLPSTGSFDR